MADDEIHDDLFGEEMDDQSPQQRRGVDEHIGTLDQNEHLQFPEDYTQQSYGGFCLYGSQLQFGYGQPPYQLKNEPHYSQSSYGSEGETDFVDDSDEFVEDTYGGDDAEESGSSINTNSDGTETGDESDQDPETAFASREDLQKWAKDRGRKYGFVIVIGRSRPNESVELLCDRGPKRPSTAKVRNTGSIKNDCAFKLVGRYNGRSDCWSLEEICQRIPLAGIHQFWRKFSFDPEYTEDVEPSLDEQFEDIKREFASHSPQVKKSFLQKIRSLASRSKSDKKEPEVRRDPRGRPKEQKAHTQRETSPEPARHSSYTSSHKDIPVPPRHSSYTSSQFKKPSTQMANDEIYDDLFGEEMDDQPPQQRRRVDEHIGTLDQTEHL
ncbi:hypothetical protein SSX86_001775 [Deinandra increscens subsp. villosa]|uniref:Uncharacterized protein n=1 Tax=Deinandra increscens subsp. villosa TaxID=3103831 RepID=A0AAP0HET4_9ASTR